MRPHPLRKRERPVLRQREQRTADVQERKIEFRIEFIRCERGVNGALNVARGASCASSKRAAAGHDADRVSSRVAPYSS